VKGVRVRWSTVRKVGLWFLGVVLTLALVLTGWVVWSVRHAFPDHDGEFALPGLSAQVTVYRDVYGIPQVFATSAEDLFKAQGYLHAQDRFWEMDFRRHVTAGRLSELFGVDQVATDAFLRTLDWRGVAARELPLLSADTRRYLQAYADGVNAWIEANGGSEPTAGKSLEYSVLRLNNSGYTVEPWSPVDSLAWLKAMAWDLRGNMKSEIGRAVLFASGLTREQVEQLYPAYPYPLHRTILPPAPVVPPPGSRPPPTFAPQLAALADTIDRLPTMLGNAAPGIGSNSFVISGNLTNTGKPLLANDPHLSASMPGIWYQMGLHCDCPYNVEGFTFSGVPGVVIGHNERIAWGFTNLDPDVTDLYLEKVDGDKVFDGTQWTPLTTRVETINVAGGAPVTIRVRSTRHGPLLSDRSQELLTTAARPAVNPSGSPLPQGSPRPTPSLNPTSEGVPTAASKLGYAVALRWTALEPGRTADALFAVDAASNWTQFRAAAALFEVPAQNMVYADVDGNIGYQSPGRIPIRGKGDGTWPAPGWDRGYDWTGYIPFEQLPSELNPTDGWIVTANQAVVDPSYRYHLTSDWSYGYRSQRIMDMIRDRTSSGRIGVGDIRAMQFDNENGFAPVLLATVDGIPLDSLPSRTRDAVALLRGWDFQQPADSAAAAYYNAFWSHLVALTFDELPDGSRSDGTDRWWEVVRPLLGQPDSPWWDIRSTPAVEHRDAIVRQALQAAADELYQRLGDEPGRWRWGDLHTLLLQNATFGKSGIGPIEWLFNRGPFGVAGGDGIVDATSWDADQGYDVTSVPSMRMIVDLSNLDNSRWIQLTGNSGHAFHPNYADQFELWRTGADLPMRWSRDSIEGSATHLMSFVSR
jgi:penicillin amidase